MEKSFSLACAFPSTISLRTVNDGDADRLRRWKNAHRQAFFFRGTITPEMQADWLRAYYGRPDDLMFVVMAGEEPFGCMGFRLAEGEADVYNVIRGRGSAGGRGAMGVAMNLMCSFITCRVTLRVSAKVLHGNPALAWYRRQAFDVVGEYEDHVVVALDRDRFQPVPFEVVPLRGGRIRS